MAAELGEDKIGFVGGMDNPSINEFLVGYIEGAQAINPDIKVATSYVGSFTDTAKGKENVTMFEKVRDIIVSNLSCDLEAVTMEASLTDDLELDSLDAVDLNAALEDELGVSMPDEVLKEVQTVGDIVRYLEEHAE